MLVGGKPVMQFLPGPYLMIGCRGGASVREFGVETPVFLLIQSSWQELCSLVDKEQTKTVVEEIPPSIALDTKVVGESLGQPGDNTTVSPSSYPRQVDTSADSG